MVKGLVPVLQVLLDMFTEPLVHGLLNVMVDQCSKDSQRLLCSGPVTDESNSSVTSASSSSSSSCSSSSSQAKTPSRCPVGSNVEDQHSALETTLHCSHSPAAPIPAEQHLPQRTCGRRWWQWQVPLPRAEVTEPLLLAATGAAYRGGPGVPQRRGTLGPKLCPALQKATPPSCTEGLSVRAALELAQCRNVLLVEAFVSVQLHADRNLVYSCLTAQSANLHSSATMIHHLAAAVCTVFGISYSGYYLTNLARHLIHVFRGADPESTEPIEGAPLGPSIPGEEAKDEQNEQNDHNFPAVVTPQPESSETVLPENGHEQIVSSEMPCQTQGELFPAQEQEEQLRQQVEKPLENEQNIEAEPQAELPEAQSDIKAVKRKNKEDMRSIQDEKNLHQQKGDQQNQVSVGVVAAPLMKHPLSCSLHNINEQAELQEPEARIKASNKRLEEEMKIIREKIIYLLQDQKALQKQVAIKKITLQGLLRKEGTIDDLMVVKMNKNPNIVNYLESYLVHGQLWLVMEYMDGGTLSDVIYETHMSEGKIAAISRECLQGLDFLHSNHIIHRDVQSHHILLRTDGSVKLADLGPFAQLLPEQSRQSSAARTSGCMAPKIKTGQPCGPKGDIWSFGIMVIEMAERKLPYWNETSVLPELLIDTERKLNLQQPKLFSSFLHDFLSCCLQRDKVQRWSAKKLLKHPFVTLAEPASSLVPLIVSVKRRKKKKRTIRTMCSTTTLE
ncbi:serine/threonine-protein kinase PAK 3-like [Chamaea fasciata]|uniref:serine/threonine-protein kinase PAK 3-like n=1 Tax=Chamaea fasciata TaxID=190680 RepID=UPI003369CD05